MTSTTKTYVCSCLNVAIEANKEQSVGDNTRQLVEQALRHTLLKGVTPVLVRDHGVHLQLPELYHQRRINQWSVFVCGLCQQETHARFASWPANLLLVNNNLLLVGDKQQMDELKKDNFYIPALGVILSSRFAVGQKRSQLFGVEFDDQQKELVAAKVERLIAQKFGDYLKQEEKAMNDRINRFTNEQTQHLHVLEANVAEQKERFKSMIESVRNHHQAINSINDKENVKGTAEAARNNNNNNNSHRGNTMEDDMGEENIFDIEDDFDMHKDKLDDENDDDVVAVESEEKKVAMTEEKRDAFRLKDSQNMSNTIEMKSYSSGRDIERMSISRSHKTVTASAVGSVPINIPDSFRGNSKENEFDEFEKVPVGESMAASIQKIARSMTNKSGSLLDDRPHRRLNTGDLLKNRMPAHFIGSLENDEDELF